MAARWRAVCPPRGKRRLGPYTLHEKLGEGGMGIVYKGSRARLERPVAIKVLRSERSGAANVRRFEREAQLSSRVSHPHAVAIYDYGRSRDGACYYAMEYVDGLDLQSWIERQGPREPAQVAHLLTQLTGALQAVHDAGLLHRDVKPANVMLCEHAGSLGLVKLVDFGLMEPLDALGGGERAGLVGTPLYLPPEAITAPASVDARSDLYSLGALGYYLLTGTPPFSGATLLEVCAQHLHALPEPPSRRRAAPVPKQLEACVLSCMAKSPDQRPESAAALGAALAPLAAEWTEQSAARPPDPVLRRGRLAA